jgi:hypothetical protein
LIGVVLFILGLFAYLLFKFIAIFITNFGATLVSFISTHCLGLSLHTVLASATLCKIGGFPRFSVVLEKRDRVPILRRVLCVTQERHFRSVGLFAQHS